VQEVVRVEGHHIAFTYIASIKKVFSIYKEGFSPSAGARQSRSHIAFTHIASIKKGFSIYKEGF
jgi:hypothetical protein